MVRIAPNPPSPYATADPTFRHIIPTPIFLPDPEPGTLTFTACDELAVVPEALTQTSAVGELPEGICPACAASMAGGRESTPRPASVCTACGSRTRFTGLCAVCRVDRHSQTCGQGSGA
ncbi:hypothetical protein ACWGB8_07940 [Kitasatospora sp. NPDC054939]